jgi:hypothetical protein
MRIENQYNCDKCGDKLSKDRIATLSTNFTPTGLVGYKQGNLGVRHLCGYCKRTFKMAFKGFFSHYNEVLKSNQTNTNHPL